MQSTEIRIIRTSPLCSGRERNGMRASGVAEWRLCGDEVIKPSLGGHERGAER